MNPPSRSRTRPRHPRAAVPALRLGLLLLALFRLAPAWAHIDVSGAWVRGTVEGQDQTGAYFVIDSDHDARLISATTPVAARAQLHEMQMDGDVMRMRPLKGLAIPAGKRVTLDETGYHLMLYGVKKPLADGAAVPLELLFVDTKGVRERVRVQATVRGLGVAAPAAAAK